MGSVYKQLNLFRLVSLGQPPFDKQSTFVLLTECCDVINVPVCVQEVEDSRFSRNFGYYI
jgi:hypothetical protein